MQDALYETLRERGLANAALSVGDLDPPLIVRLWRSRRVDHQIFNLVGDLNPFIHAPVIQNSF
ncbi:hypothetical protein IQ276_020850 [Desmonostoc muscorum LEGE 12446]|uniref:Uncharacterized protein n=2 Tax=Desmonostoc muscorum TaxID=1179 RepID=A0A8J7CZX3_DESMC|nr:hypothetical protein [Desmonostoc muscorum LEGE 12446]